MRTFFDSYATLGLVGSLKQADSGGSECPLPMVVAKSFGEGSSTRPRSNIPTDETEPQRYGKIIRDADGNVVGVEMLGENIQGEDNVEEEDIAVNECDPKQKTGVVHGACGIHCLGSWLWLIEHGCIALERLAGSSKPVPRFSSDGEIASLRKLIAKHGRDFDAMAKDRRLNIWQVRMDQTLLMTDLIPSRHLTAYCRTTGESVRSLSLWWS